MPWRKMRNTCCPFIRSNKTECSQISLTQTNEETSPEDKLSDPGQTVAKDFVTSSPLSPKFQYVAVTTLQKVLFLLVT